MVSSAAGVIRPKGGSSVSQEGCFAAFVIEDERQRDFLKGHSLHARAPFEFIDMSVKEPYESNWKERVRARTWRSHGVIALVSKNSLASSGQKWEVQRAEDEGTPVRGIWACKDDRAKISGISICPQNDANISSFYRFLQASCVRRLSSASITTPTFGI